jgi:hypothetical protein
MLHCFTEYRARLIDRVASPQHALDALLVLRPQYPRVLYSLLRPDLSCASAIATQKRKIVASTPTISMAYDTPSLGTLGNRYE